MAEEQTKKDVEAKGEEVKSEKKAEVVSDTPEKKPIVRKTFTGRRKGRRGFERPKSEFDQKIISLRRVTRVMAGGRRFSFSVAMVIGDKKGRVGLGTGKAADTTLAIGKAFNRAKKNLFKVNVTQATSIPYEIKIKFSSARIKLMPNQSKGIIAGSAVRDVLNLAGLHNVTGKILSRSKNKLNIAKATLNALKEL